MPISTEVDLTLPQHMRKPEDFLWNQLNALLLCAEEQAWLLEHLDESPAKALKDWDESIPHRPEAAKQNPWCMEHPGVNPKDMKILLRRIRDVEDSEPERFGFYKRLPQIAPLIMEQPNEEFTGLEALYQVIRDAQVYMSKYQAIKDRTPTMARHPTLYTTDARGRMTHQGVGSDRGIVRAFVAYILHEETHVVDPVWASAAAQDNIPVTEKIEESKVEGARADYRLIEGDNFYECPVKDCNKRIEYDADDEGDRRKAWSGMRTHMLMIKKQVDDHREAKTVIFG